MRHNVEEQTLSQDGYDVLLYHMTDLLRQSLLRKLPRSFPQVFLILLL